jgi:hypothetical protein
VAKPYDVEYDYDLFFDQLDANKDTIITKSELSALLTKFTASGNRQHYVLTIT